MTDNNPYGISVWCVCIYDTYNLYVFTQVTPENGIYEVEHNFMKK